MRVLLFVLVALLSTTSSFAQNKTRKKIDSLLVVLKTAKGDTNEVNILNGLSGNYKTINPDTGLLFANKACLLATKISWIKGKGWAINSRGNIYQATSNFSKALECYDTCKELFEQIDNKVGIATAYGNIGIVHAMQGEYPIALNLLLKSVKIYEEIGDKSNLAKFIGNVGNIYKEQGNYTKALDYYFKSLQLADETQNKIARSNALCNIGSVYQYKNDFEKALDYDNQAMVLLQEIGNKNGEEVVSGNIGNVYKKLKDYTKALEHYYKSLQLSEEMGDKKMEANVKGNIGDVYAETKNYTMAIQFTQEALKIDELIGNLNNTAIAYAQIGHTYLEMAEDSSSSKPILINGDLPFKQYIPDGSIPKSKKERLQLAIKNLGKGAKIADSLKILEYIKDFNVELAEAYNLNGDYKKAFECYKTYSIIKDTIFSQTNEKNQLKTAMQYDFDKKELADSLKNVEREKIVGLKLERQRNYTYISVVGLLVLGLFSFFIVKERKKSDGLLLNILPKEVAQELKEKGSAAAKHFNEVTVLFTDFVGFTTVSEKLGAQEPLNTK